MRLEVSVLSKAGGRAVNEDAYGVWSGAGSNTCFVVLSDGAGGHGGGDVAAKIVVEQALEWFRQQPVAGQEIVRAALEHANESVMREQKSALPLADMRATAVVLALDTAARHAVWMHVGDSRLYAFRDGRILTRTRDHSVLQSMIDAGYVTDVAICSNPQRNMLLSALGDHAAFTHASPAGMPIEPGDAFLLCSDGLWDYVDDAEMATLLAEAATVEAWVRALEDTVLARAGTHHDNYSAVAVRCSDAADYEG